MLAVINPTSAAAHIADLKALNSDVTVVSEPSLTKGGQKHVTAELAEGEHAKKTMAKQGRVCHERVRNSLKDRKRAKSN